MWKKQGAEQPSGARVQSDMYPVPSRPGFDHLLENETYAVIAGRNSVT